MDDRRHVEPLVFNGIDGASGDYLLPPLTLGQVAVIAQGEVLDESHLEELRWWHRRITQAHLGPAEGIDPRNLGRDWLGRDLRLRCRSLRPRGARRATRSPSSPGGGAV
jgi:hypothetical protein